jgi:cysteine desulfurase
MDKCVYLDYNGTTPIYPPVLEAMLPYFVEHFGNPSSSHYYGQAPKVAVRKARLALLKVIQPAITVNNDGGGETNNAIDPSSIVFTGCGTESNNMAIRLALLSSLHKADANGILHVITTTVEHPAITQCLLSYSSQDNGLTPNITVSYIPVNNEGIVSVQDVIQAIQPNTALVTVMTANNEVGSIQPVFELAKYCRERNVIFHTDAAQAVGKIDLRELGNSLTGADLITLVGHKFGAPKGIAALYIRPTLFTNDERSSNNGRSTNHKDVGGSVLLMGGGQEFGRRGGTENVPYIVGMGRAAELLFEKKRCGRDGWEYNAQHMSKMRDRLLLNITHQLEDGGDTKKYVSINGPIDPKYKLPNTLSVGIRGVRSGELLVNIGNVVACSAGSACHASCSDDIGTMLSYSSILKAMNVPVEFAVGTLRLSVGPDTTEEEVDYAAEVIVKEAKRQLGKT